MYIQCKYRTTIHKLSIETRDGMAWYVVFFWLIFILFYFIVSNATFSNISAISWQPVLVVEEVGVPGENHRLGKQRSKYVMAHLC